MHAPNDDHPPADDTAKRRRPLSYQEVAGLSREAAAREIVRQYERHQETLPRDTIRLGVVLVAGAAAAIWWHPLLGPVFVVAAVYALWTLRRRLQRAWVRKTVVRIEAPVGRMRVVVMMLSRTRRGGCDRAMLTRLLTRAPDVMTCATLGRHVTDCPHANAW